MGLLTDPLNRLLWENFSPIQRKLGDAEVDWAMFSASIVNVAVWNRGPKIAWQQY